MSEQGSDPSDAELLRQRTLSRWDNEGGAGPGPQTEMVAAGEQVSMPSNDSAEVGALHIRIIALENLVISLLATASDQQLEQAGEMARYISPRSGFTRHPLTAHAAAHMVDLVERASRFRNRSSPSLSQPVLALSPFVQGLAADGRCPEPTSNVLLKPPLTLHCNPLWKLTTRPGTHKTSSGMVSG